MATTTPNFGWSVPTSTDLVKDGATAIETLGDSIDASLLDLKGGTSGQVLAKNSGTDMDFVWVTTDDTNAIQNAIVDAKGDLIGATAADTPARLAVGANGTVLTADSAEATGLKWATPTSGGMTSIASGSLSGSSLSLTAISGSYKNLQLVLRNAQVSATTDWRLKINNNSGGIYNRVQLNGAATTATTGASENGTSQNLTFNNPATGSATSMLINLYDYTKTTSYKQMDFLGTYNYSGGQETFTWRGAAQDANAITRIDVTLDTGNFTAGTYTLYGVN